MCGQRLIVSASKGIENQTHLTMSGVLAPDPSHIPETRIAVLSAQLCQGSALQSRRLSRCFKESCDGTTGPACFCHAGFQGLYHDESSAWSWAAL